MVVVQVSSASRTDAFILKPKSALVEGSYVTRTYPLVEIELALPTAFQTSLLVRVSVKVTFMLRARISGSSPAAAVFSSEITEPFSL